MRRQTVWCCEAVGLDSTVASTTELTTLYYCPASTISITTMTPHTTRSSIHSVHSLPLQAHRSLAVSMTHRTQWSDLIVPF